MTIDQEEVFTEMFDQSWRALNESFYDGEFHGADWNAVRAKYRPLVKHIAMKEDLYTLISLMLGELNASHLGIAGKPPDPEQVTADLGLIFDDSYRGPGLSIAEILRGGPADQRGLAIQPGDLLLENRRNRFDSRTKRRQAAQRQGRRDPERSGCPGKRHSQNARASTFRQWAASKLPT